MRILITDGIGMVSSAIQKISKNYPEHTFIFVSSKDYDLREISQTRLMFLKNYPECIIHLAANVGGSYKNLDKKVEIFEDNLAINLNIVKCCGEMKIKNLIACLSTCIFPSKTSYPIDETMIHLGPPHYTNEEYAYTNRILEIHMKKYKEQYGYNYMCIIPCNIYGPNDNFDLHNSYFIPALIKQCYLAKKNKKDFIVKGDETNLRQFIYSEDLAEIILNLIRKKNINISNLIIAPEEEISIKDLAKIIKESYNFIKEVKYDKSFSNGQDKKTVSNLKLREIFPDYNFTSLEYGIRETVCWFVGNK